MRNSAVLALAVLGAALVMLSLVPTLWMIRVPARPAAGSGVQADKQPVEGRRPANAVRHRQRLGPADAIGPCRRVLSLLAPLRVDPHRDWPPPWLGEEWSPVPDGGASAMRWADDLERETLRRLARLCRLEKDVLEAAREADAHGRLEHVLQAWQQDANPSRSAGRRP